ncbi:MAG: sugar-transfer associated ATP-grasp domain-containing protein [Hyphomonadaceae bacterium]
MGALSLDADTLGKVRRFLREDVPYWLSMPDKKPVAQQLREMADLWSAYRFFPYQYFKHDLYVRSVGSEYLSFFPSIVADKSIDYLNPREYAPTLEDKVQLDSRLVEAGLPTINTFAILTVANGGVVARDQAGAPLSWEEFLALGRRQCEVGLFVKPRLGGQGIGAHKLEWTEHGLAREGSALTEASFAALLEPYGYDEYLVQPFFVQHAVMQAFNPGSVNTLRVVTFRSGPDDVELVGTALRVGAGDSDTDNWSGGGLIANVEMPSGRVAAVARTKLGYARHRVTDRHPLTGVVFGDVTIPFASEVRDVVIRGAHAFAPVRLIGWDIAIGADGPRVLEGNYLSAFLMLQDACGGLRNTAVGDELAKKYGWR